MSKAWFIIIVICLYSVCANSQKTEKRIPLHSYLQDNFDTTIIIHSYSSWELKPNYCIVSFKNARMYAFTYKSPLPRLGGYAGLPKDLSEKFIMRILAFQNTLPDTNAYFIPYSFPSGKKNDFKQSLDSLQPWNIDDKEVKDCAELDSDAPEHKIWFIVKNKITQLYFYDLEHMDEACPGSITRQKAIRLIKAFNYAFQ